MNIDNSGPAFPRTGYYPDTSGCDVEGLRERFPTITEPRDGMSLRDYFAAKAMEGMLTGTLGRLSESREASAYAVGHCNAAVADRAYAIADAMLAARK